MTGDIDNNNSVNNDINITNTPAKSITANKNNSDIEIENTSIEEMLKSNIAMVHNEHDNIINETIEATNNEELETDINHINIAHNAIVEKDKEKAFNEYKAILDEDENNIEALYFIASYYKSYGNREAALSLFEKLLHIGVVNTGVYENIALLNFEKSSEYFAKALKIYNSTDINFYHLRRIIYITLDRYKNKDYETAYSYCLLAVSVSNSIFLYNLMGCICYKLEYYDDALSSFYNAITKENKLNYAVLSNIAYCYKEKGSIKLAIHYFLKAIEISDKHDAKLFFALGYAYYSLGNYRYAKYCINRSLEIDSDNNEALEILKKINLSLEK